MRRRNLFPGPCILMDYRNRGLSTLLLSSALHDLRDAGMTRACAGTRESSPATRFLYPKFGGHSSLIEPLLAAYPILPTEHAKQR